MSTAKIHVAVLMGGWSAEREVSLSSGKACALALKKAGYKITSVDADRAIAQTLAKLKPDVAFNALHGKWGEDGAIQGILEVLEIPYTHSGVLASALAMNKPLAKEIFARQKIPLAPSKIVTREIAATGEVMAPPFVVKPIDEGSSVGVQIVHEWRDLDRSAIAGERFDPSEPIMIERYIPGRELTCAVMGNIALGVTEIISETKFYDYEAKYAPGGSRHVVPAELDPGLYREVQQYALKAHLALGCRGVSRSDFRFDDTIGEPGELVILATNTQPGMTETSLVPELAVHAGHTFEELVQWMVEDASINR
jgi:D-alanine-D-alanine ligase